MKRSRVLVSCLLFSLAAAVNSYSQDLVPASSVELKIFDTGFIVNTYQVNKNRKQALKFVVLHHDEQTGLKVAKEIISQRGGQLFELVSRRNELPTRKLYFEYREEEYAIDPNRLFTSAGIIKDVRKRTCFETKTEGETTETSCHWERPVYEDYEIVIPEIRLFSEALLRLLKPLDKGGAVVSVHNNSNYGYSLSSYTHGGAEWRSSEKGFFFGKEDVDNFFLVTNDSLFRKLYSYDPDTWDFNIVLQKQPPNPDDGSLSIYSGRHGWNYILVEAQSYSGEERQRQMINRLIDTFEKSS